MLAIRAFWHLVAAQGWLSGMSRGGLRGWNGTFAFDLAGKGGGIWHVSNGWRAGRGAGVDPCATVSMEAADLGRLLSGKTSFSVLLLTGRIGIRGEGRALVLLATMAARARSLRWFFRIVA